MRRASAYSNFATLVAFFIGYGSAADAGTSYKVVTAPNSAEQAQAEPRAVPHADEPIFGEPEPGARPTDNPVAMSSPVSAQQIVMRSSTGRQVDLGKPFSKITISNPQIVDALPITDRSIVLQAIKQGVADVFFFDLNGKLIRDLAVQIDDFSDARQNPIPDPLARPYSSVEIHNKALVSSQTNFRCGSDGCHYIGEITVTEPAPLPHGHTETQGTYTNTYTGLPSNPPAIPPSNAQ